MKIKACFLTLLAVCQTAFGEHDLSVIPGMRELNTVILDLVLTRTDGWDNRILESDLDDVEKIKAMQDDVFKALSEVTFLERHYFFHSESRFSAFLNDPYHPLPLEERESIVRDTRNYNITKEALTLRKKAIFHHEVLLSFILSRYPNYTLTDGALEFDEIKEQVIYHNFFKAALEALEAEKAFRL